MITRDVKSESEEKKKSISVSYPPFDMSKRPAQDTPAEETLTTIRVTRKRPAEAATTQPKRTASRKKAKVGVQRVLKGWRIPKLLSGRDY